MALNSTPGDPNADSYAAVADADAYFLGVANATWAAAITADKENALRGGTRYLDNQYRGKWIGIRVAQLQSLAWPRMDGARGPLLVYPGYLLPLYDIDGFQIDDTVVPLQVQQAAMEAAALILGGEVMQPLLVRGNAIKSTAVGVGGAITQTIVYQDGAPATNRYLTIEGLLRALVTASPGASSGGNMIVRG